MQLPEHADRLTKNPLGIVALFLFLVYGIAGLVLSFTTQSLTEQERFPLILFLVGFPVLVLALFAWLVAKHHTKLYAPSDYRDSEGFFRAMSPSERRERLEREVQELSKAPATVPHEEATPVTRATSTIREQVVLAEDLALRAVEVEFGRPVLRQVRSEGRAFDGVLTLPTGEVAVEVKYTYHRGWQRIANDAVALASTFMGKGRARPVSLLLVVVVDSLTPEQIKHEREQLERRLADSPAVSVKLRVFTLDELKRQFGLFERPNIRLKLTPPTRSFWKLRWTFPLLPPPGRRGSLAGNRWAYKR